MIVDLTEEHDVIDVENEQQQGNSFPYELRLVRKKNPSLVNIYHALKELVLTIRYKVSCEWNYDDGGAVGECYSPVLTFTSAVHPDRHYLLAIHFVDDYPQSFPTLEPLNVLPALPYLVIQYHPILCSKYWTESQSLTEIIELVIQHLDTLPSIPDFDQLKLPQKGKSTQNTFHTLISDLYSIYKDDLKGYLHLEQVILSLFPQDFCIFLGSTTTATSNTTVGKGIGYTGGYGGHSAAKPTKQSLTKTKSEEVVEQMDKALTAKITDPASIEWIIESPLVDMLALIMKQLSREEISRHVNYVACIYRLLLRIDQSLPSLPPPAISAVVKPTDTADSSSSSSSSLSAPPTPLKHLSAGLSPTRISQIQEMITSTYSRLLDPIILEDFTGAKNAWLKEVQNSSLFPANTIDLNKEEEKDSNSNSSGEEGKGSDKPKQRVFHLPDIENEHYFYKNPAAIGSSSSASKSFVKCSKAWMKELNFIEENLMDELVLFVSEDHPNYLIALMHITNPDSPYYGGTYVFHILIPADYPSSCPKVHFMTTGGGTVRFNPNLYNCGKVCLSLLGTWAGEPWSPKTSNLTQVIKSILFLIFTEEPFYNEPGYQYTQRLAPQSLHYNYNIMQNNLKFAILAHLQENYVTNTGSSIKNPTIYEYVRDYYHMNWYETILPNLEEKLSTIYKPLSNFQASLNAINKLIPEPPPPLPATAMSVEGGIEGGEVFVDLTDDRPKKRQRKNGPSSGDVVEVINENENCLVV